MPMRLLRHASLLILSLLISACGLLDLKDRALDSLVRRIPSDMEESLGRQILPSVLPAEAIVRDAELQAELQSLLRILITRNKINQPRIRLYISRDPALNAFALPGGILIFNAGMLTAAGSPEEILGVAAHELAHVTEKHVLKSMVQSLGLTAIVMFFLGDVSELGVYILRQSQVLLQNGFSRKQEAEADDIGLDYLIAAGVHPQGLLQFLQRLEQKKSNRAQDKSLEKVSTFLSTHPLTADRIRNIKERTETLPSSERQKLKPVQFDLKGFQTRLLQKV